MSHPLNPPYTWQTLDQAHGWVVATKRYLADPDSLPVSSATVEVPLAGLAYVFNLLEDLARQPGQPLSHMTEEELEAYVGGPVLARRDDGTLEPGWYMGTDTDGDSRALVDYMGGPDVLYFTREAMFTDPTRDRVIIPGMTPGKEA